MKKMLSMVVVLVLANLVNLPTSCAQPVSKTYKMPASLLKQLKLETEQRRRGECEQKKSELFSRYFYALNSEKLLLLLGLPDYFCGSGSFMPVTIDSQGHWEFGAVIESSPSELLTDSLHRLWLLSHFEIEAVFPLLHHGTDGTHWQELSLPKPGGIDCCFVWLKQICIIEPQLQLKFAGMDDTQPEYWGTNVTDSLTVTPHWQKLTAQQVKNEQQCQIIPLTSGDWQRKIAMKGEKVLFQSAARRVTVIIPRWLN